MKNDSVNINILSYKEEIIQKAVENLIDFGYKDVNCENIFIVKVFSLFFKEMLKEAQDKYKYNNDIIEICDELLNEINLK